MKAIYVTGFMGAGKTTIGRQIGEKLQVDVIDTDQYIEEQVGKKIAAVFSEDGEPTFRRYEREYLQKLPTNDIVITTGGGIVIQEVNRKWMKEHGHVVYLHCDLKEIFKRVGNDPTRPLFDANQKEKMRKLYEDRLPFYQEADCVIETTGKTYEDILNQIKLWLHSLEDGNND